MLVLRVPEVLVLRVPVVLVLRVPEVLALRVPVVPVLVGRAPLVPVDRVRAAVRVRAGRAARPKPVLQGSLVQADRAPLVQVDRVRAAVRVLAGPPKVVHDPAATRNRRRRAHRNLAIPLKSGNGRGVLAPLPRSSLAQRLRRKT